MTDYDIINELIEKWFTGGKLSIQGQQTTLLDKVAILENGKIYVMLHFNGFKPFYIKKLNGMLAIGQNDFIEIFTKSIFNQLEKKGAK